MSTIIYDPNRRRMELVALPLMSDGSYSGDVPDGTEVLDVAPPLRRHPEWRVLILQPLQPTDYGTPAPPNKTLEIKAFTTGSLESPPWVYLGVIEGPGGPRYAFYCIT